MGSVSVTVTNDCVLKVTDDTHGRKSEGGILETANSLGTDSITASADSPAGGGGNGSYDWTVTSPLGGASSSHGPKVTFPVAAPGYGTVFLLVDLVPNTYTVSVDCGPSPKIATIKAYSDVKNTINIDPKPINDIKDKINIVLGLALGGGQGSVDGPHGKVTFDNQWKECPTSNKANWTYKVNAGLNPAIGASYTQCFCSRLVAKLCCSGILC